MDFETDTYKYLGTANASYITVFRWRPPDPHKDVRADLDLALT
jgi:hypothetical protein